MTLVEIGRAFADDRCPTAAVPQHHRSTAIFALGNRTFEIGIGERMIFGAYGKTLVVGVGTRPARYGPAFEDAVDFKTKIPVQSRCIVLLHDKAIALGRGNLSCGLGGFRKVAFGVVAFERISARHGVLPVSFRRMPAPIRAFRSISSTLPSDRSRSSHLWQAPRYPT